MESRIKMLREKRGLIQELLAVEIGVTQQMLSKYEKDITIIKVDMLMRTLKFIRGQQKKSIIISSGNYPNILFPGTLPKSSRILQDCIWPFLQQSCYHFYLFRIHEKIPMNYYIQSLLRQSNIYVGK